MSWTLGEQTGIRTGTGNVVPLPSPIITQVLCDDTHDETAESSRAMCRDSQTKAPT